MKQFILVVFLALSPVLSSAKSTANLDKDGVILSGYDPVSYFKGATPVKGRPEFNFEQSGVKYLFSSAENLAEFKKSPEKYTPAYQGWCSTAVLKNDKVEIDPLNYKVTDGRLFLFYKTEGVAKWIYGDTKKVWEKGEPDNIKKADSNWTTLKDKE